MNENPYSAPLVVDYPLVRREFRPDWWASWLAWAARGGNRPARVGGDAWVLRTPTWAMTLVWLMALAGPAVVVIGASDLRAPEWTPWALSLFCLTIGCLGICSTKRIRVSADGIHSRGPFFRTRQGRWQDFVRVTFDCDGEVQLTASDGTRIEVEADLTGVADFPDLLERHLPRELRRDCEADLGMYRRFLGN